MSSQVLRIRTLPFCSGSDTGPIEPYNGYTLSEWYSMVGPRTPVCHSRLVGWLDGWQGGGGRLIYFALPKNIIFQTVVLTLIINNIRLMIYRFLVVISYNIFYMNAAKPLHQQVRLPSAGSLSYDCM